MRPITRVLAACALVGAAVVAVAMPRESAPAAAATPLRFVSGWIPVWSAAGLTGLNGDSRNAAVMFEMSPFNYSVTSATTFAMSSSSTANLKAAAAALRAKGIAVIPSLTDGISKGTEEGMANVLRNQRDVHVQAIVNLVMTGVDGVAFDGIDLDYEGFAFDDLQSSWQRTQPVWDDFVVHLADALHAQGKLLSVTVPVGVAVATAYSVYDWRGIIPSIDRLRLMTYDYSYSVPGPVSPASWVQAAISFTKALVQELGRDPGMVQIGVPTYGRNWAAVLSGTCANSVLGKSDPTMKSAKALAAANGATPTRHASGEMTFTYDELYTSGGVRLGLAGQTATVFEVARHQDGASPSVPLAPPMLPLAAPRLSAAALVDVRGPADGGAMARAQRLGVCKVRHTVFYPDENTVLQRAQMVFDAGLGGIAIWAQGYEAPELWPLLRDFGNQHAA